MSRVFTNRFQLVGLRRSFVVHIRKMPVSRLDENVPLLTPCKRHTGETRVPLPASSRGHLDEILQQLKANLLAFLRMKLRCEHVVLPDRRGETFAVRRPRCDNRRINRFGKKAVHEINVTAVSYVAQNRTTGSNHLDLVPADLRNLQSGLPGKTDNLSLTG